MSAPPRVDKPAPTKTTRAPKQTGGANLAQERSQNARRVAAAVLEVLAGARTPVEAATALELSVPRYYQVEAQALRGLLLACEPKPKGRQPNAQSEMTALRHENQRLQREVTRQQALARATQRAAGLTPPPAPSVAKSGKKTRKRRVVRALSVAQRLRQDNDPIAAPPPPAIQEAV